MGLTVWVSQAWRSELENALGTVAAWVIPVPARVRPGLVIGFLCATLLLTRYQPPPLDPPAARGHRRVAAGDGDRGAYNEEAAIEPTLDRIAATSYPGPLPVVLADNNSSDRTAELGAAAAARPGSTTGGASSRWPASITRSTPRSRT